MAVGSLNEAFKFLFLKKVSKFLIPHTKLTESLKSAFKTNINVSPIRDLDHVKRLIPLTNANIKMKSSTNIYEHLVKQAVSQTKFCTKSEEGEAEPPASGSGRHEYHKETSEAVNRQIGAEFNAAFCYLSMACYFGRTDVALPGCQGFFMNMYQEEMDHALVFLNYQLLRGSHVVLCDIEMADCQDWTSIKKAFCTALEMEKFIKEVLVSVYDIAEKHKDLQVMDIISTQFMEEQNRSICEMARLLKKADMTDDLVGEYLFDKMIFNSFVKKSKDNLMYNKKIDEEKDPVYK